MASNSKIEWTGHTWNPLAGCTRASEGCDHCYAFVMTKRLVAMGQQNYMGLTGNGHFNGVVRTLPTMLDVPMRRKKPTIYFVNSMSDLFHKEVPDEFIDQVFAVMASCPQHTFQILTKRADRMAKYMCNPDRLENIYAQWYSVSDQPPAAEAWPLPNVWLGVSVENQEQADKRIPHLLGVPARVRFLSCEPLLGPVDLSAWLPQECLDCDNYILIHREEGTVVHDDSPIHWVICGGESGHGARPMHPEWARSLMTQCYAAGVPFFFKQWGEWLDQDCMTNEQYGMIAELDPQAIGGVADFKRPSYLFPTKDSLVYRIGKKAAGRLLDGVEYSEFPA